MKTLAIDTSLATGSVAAIDGGRLAARPLGGSGEHARLVAAALVDAAAELGWHPRDADLVAVVRGPGSFTGLRVGVTAAKAIAWANGCRLLGVSGFEISAGVAGAAAGWPEAAIHVAYDAGRGEVFAATVVPSATSPTGWCTGPGGLAPLGAWLDALPLGARVTGPALDVETVRHGLAARPDLRLAPEGSRGPHAAAAARLALLRARAGAGDDPAALVPDYLRPSYAEERPSQTGTA